jgi:hypothetical protein
MYTVRKTTSSEKSEFSDILDAIDCCKESPKTIIRDSNDKVLMRHKVITKEEEIDIMLAKMILKIQMTNN